MHLGNDSDSFGHEGRRTTLIFSKKSSAVATLNLANQLLKLFTEYDPTGFVLKAMRSHVMGSTVKVGFFAVCLILSMHGATRAQSPTGTTESLTLDQAIDLALRNNHAIKIAQFEVAKADEDISVAKTSRLPSLHLHTLFSGNLAKNDIRVPNPAANQFPGLGPFFLLTDERKLSTVFATTAVEPLSQQYRIGLHIKLEHLSREMAQAKLRQQQNETIDQVKKTYYAIVQTNSALSSVEQTVKSYQELDKVTG